MVSVLDAESRHFDYCSSIVSNITHIVNQGGENATYALFLYNEHQKADIDMAFHWISSAFLINTGYAKKCCYFILNSRAFLINDVPKKRLEWLTVAYQASRLINESNIEIEILLEMGSTHWFMGNLNKATQLYQEVISFEKSHDSIHPKLIATALGVMGLAQKDLGNLHQAKKYLVDALTRFDDPKERSIYLPILGRCYHHLGDIISAKESYIEALLIAHKIGDLRGKADIIGNIGLLYSAKGEYRKSIRLYSYALNLARKVYDVRGESNLLINTALAHIKLGNYADATYFANEAMAICSKMQNLKGQMKCNYLLARSSLQRLDFLSAYRYFISMFKLSIQMKNLTKLWRLFSE